MTGIVTILEPLEVNAKTIDAAKKLIEDRKKEITDKIAAVGAEKGKVYFYDSSDKLLKTGESTDEHTIPKGTTKIVANGDFKADKIEGVTNYTAPSNIVSVHERIHVFVNGDVTAKSIDAHSNISASGYVSSEKIAGTVIAGQNINSEEISGQAIAKNITAKSISGTQTHTENISGNAIAIKDIITEKMAGTIRAGNNIFLNRNIENMKGKAFANNAIYTKATKSNVELISPVLYIPNGTVKPEKYPSDKVKFITETEFEGLIASKIKESKPPIDKNLARARAQVDCEAKEGNYTHNGDMYSCTNVPYSGKASAKQTKL